MRLSLHCALVLVLSVLALPMLAMDTNVDLQKKGGDDAYDFAVVLEGQEDVTNTYDGWSSCHFQTVTQDTAGGNTVIHWEHPTGSLVDPPSEGIQDGEEIHLGFSVADGEAKIVDCYWTDEDGARIFGSKVLVVGGHIGSNWVGIQNNTSLIGQVSQVRYAVFGRPFDLADLSTQSETIMAALQPLGVEPFDLAPGEEREFLLPEPAPPGSAVVLVIDADSPESDAATITFLQDVVE